MLMFAKPANRAATLPQLVMDHIDQGLIVCDPDGMIVHANRAAKRELEAGEVLHLMDGRLICRGKACVEFSAALQAAASRGRRRLVCAGEPHTLMLVVTPVDGTSTCGDAVLVMIGRRTPCTPLGVELLAIRHRLTLAEQRVLRALIGGAAAGEIAEAHSVAVSTVRTQIQSIRDKLGVSSIDSLLLRAACVPPVPSCH